MWRRGSRFSMPEVVGVWGEEGTRQPNLPDNIELPLDCHDQRSFTRQQRIDNPWRVRNCPSSSQTLTLISGKAAALPAIPCFPSHSIECSDEQ